MIFDFAEHASSKNNNVDGNDPPRLLSPTYHQVAGRVNGKCGRVLNNIYISSSTSYPLTSPVLLD